MCQPELEWSLPLHVTYMLLKVTQPIDLGKESHLKSQRAGDGRRALPELGVYTQDGDVGLSVTKSLPRCRMPLKACKKAGSRKLES